MHTSSCTHACGRSIPDHRLPASSILHRMYSNQMSTGNVTTRLYNDAIIRRSVPKNEFVPNPPPKGEPKSSG